MMEIQVSLSTRCNLVRRPAVDPGTRMEDSIYDRIYELVKKIPPGRVASYGRIARMVGCGPRQVGYAMATVPYDQQIPWHRVINSQGKISSRGEGGGETEQHQRLVQEGVTFNRSGRIDFERFGWQSEEVDFFDSFESDMGHS